MDENQKQKFKIRLITLNEKLKKKQDLSGTFSKNRIYV